MEHGSLPIFLCETSTTSVLKHFGYSGRELWDSWYKPFFDFVDENDVRGIAHNFYFFTDTLILESWKKATGTSRYIYSSSNGKWEQ